MNDCRDYTPSIISQKKLSFKIGKTEKFTKRWKGKFNPTNSTFCNFWSLSIVDINIDNDSDDVNDDNSENDDTDLDEEILRSRFGGILQGLEKFSFS